MRAGGEQRAGTARYAVAARAGAGGTAPRLLIRVGGIAELAISWAELAIS